MTIIYLTKHSIDRAVERYPELAKFDRSTQIRMLLSVIHNGQDVDVDSVVLGQRFVQGYLRTQELCREIWFILKPEDGRWVVITTLTPQEMAGNGAIRHT